ncbi:MFS transporter [Flavivirga aquimarina]|uniref:MFS transporter n=1 Tax=Flavivirga aquimarina TaxID=2027862 RepID=A0ABT8WBK2_9FLAO|nr:MFS transporter [Flavivirga aquimarina]MDO5970500.1 MFS transporter [Flavivirga aquimarina]
MKKIIPFLIIIATLCIQVSSGINYIIFPLTIQVQGYSKTLIGLAMSCEILATIILFKHISVVVKRLGVVQTVIGASIIRGVVIYILGFNEYLAFWFMGIFTYGLSTSMVLVVVQTWLNLAETGKLKGLFIGLYSSSLSLGIALGPILLQFIPSRTSQFVINAMITLFPCAILATVFKYRPTLTSNKTVRIGFIFKHAKIIMLSALVGGVCFFGLPSFLTLYGIANDLSPNEAALLLTMFMIGSVSIGAFISSLSAFIDRILIIYICVCFSVVCAVFLSLAVYAHLGVALTLLVIWGGSMGGIYATGLAYIGQVFRKEDQISANTSFVLMDALGGFLGLFVIGTSMDFIGDEGLTYTIVIASTCYLIFITKRLTAKL